MDDTTVDRESVIGAQAPDFEQTYTALKSAYAKLRFVTQPKWELESATV